MDSATQHQGQHLTQHQSWPSERFLWAVLDAPGLAHPGPLPPGLRAACEDEIPQGDLHVVCTPMGDGTALACAATTEAIASLGPQVLSLTPASLPAFAPATIDPASLNLLVGRFEPASVRRARASRHLLALATVAICAGLLCLGLLRRAEAWRGRARDADAAALSVARSVVGDGTSLAGELERAQREARVEVRPPPDAAAALASFLTAWPTAVQSKPLSINIGAETALIAITVEGDPAPFLKAIKAPAGWTLDEPRLATVQNITRLSLTLRRGGTS